VSFGIFGVYSELRKLCISFVCCHIPYIQCARSENFMTDGTINVIHDNSSLQNIKLNALEILTNQFAHLLSSISEHVVSLLFESQECTMISIRINRQFSMAQQRLVEDIGTLEIFGSLA